MEKAAIVVEVLLPSLPSFVSFVPYLVFVSKNTPAVGSKRRGAFMNQPQRGVGVFSEQFPNSSKYSLDGKKASLSLRGAKPFFVFRSQVSGSISLSSDGSQTSSPMIKYPSFASLSSSVLS